MSRRNREEGYGCTPRELEVERLHLAGHKPHSIAEIMGIKRSTVSVIMTRLYPKPEFHEADIRLATQQLGEAITRAYPQGIPA